MSGPRLVAIEHRVLTHYGVVQEDAQGTVCSVVYASLLDVLSLTRLTVVPLYIAAG